MKKTATISALAILGSAILIFSIFLLLGSYNNYNENKNKIEIDLSTINSYDDCVLAGFDILEIFPEQCQTLDGRTFVNENSEFASKNVNISGLFTCLPPKDVNVPHDDMCSYGLKTESGDYYGLREVDGSEAALFELRPDDKIGVEGVFMPGVDIRYDSLGTIEVERLEIISKAEVTNPDLL